LIYLWREVERAKPIDTDDKEAKGRESAESHVFPGWTAKDLMTALRVTRLLSLRATRVYLKMRLRVIDFRINRLTKRKG
jgi:hypothetical protein